MNQDKVFVVDIDGTLLTKGERISDQSIEVLEKVANRGYILIAATGRTETQMSAIWQQFHSNPFSGLVLADGQYICDLTDGTVGAMPYLSFADVVKIMNVGNRLLHRLDVYAGDRIYHVYRHWLNLGFLKNVASVIVHRQWALHKVITMRNGMSGIDIDKVVIDGPEAMVDLGALSDLYEITFNHDKRRYEIKQNGVNKARGVELLLQKWSLDDQFVYVFGNDQNDICLFQRFTNSYAVANAIAQAKERARNILNKDRNSVATTIWDICEGANDECKGF